MSILRTGQEILVNSATAGFQGNQQITALSNGGFVVTWDDRSLGVGGTGGDTSLAAVKAQVFTAGGTPVGPEILVNSATEDYQFYAQITALSHGGFVVTWQDGSGGVGGATGDTSPYAVKAQVFAAGGTPVGSEILVNSATAGSQINPQITALQNGGFVVTWQDFSQGVGGAGGDTSGNAVKAQVFAAGGTPVGAEILVNSATAGDQENPQITALSNGGFVVTWYDFSHGAGGAGGDTSGSAVKAQVFFADGTPEGSEILVNSATAGAQIVPQITALENGGFVVTWFGQDGSDFGVKAQVFGFNLPQALANDFNGDGHGDILWQNTDGTAAVWTVDGTSLVAGANVAFNPGPAWHVIGSGDFSGDGKSDILWQNNDGTVAEWLMNGSSLVSGGSVAFNPGAAWHAIG